MVTISINNNRCKIDCHLKTLIKLRNLTRIRHPGAFHLRRGGHVQKGWDGFVYCVTETGGFDTGLLPQMYGVLKDNFKLDIELIDNRNLDLDFEIPDSINEEITPRPYQKEAALSILDNYVGDLHFPRGILFAATNAGKTIIAALFHAAIKDAQTVLLINQKDLFEDAMKDIPKWLGYDEVGWVHSKDIKWAPFMICMVPTLRSRLPMVVNKLATYRTVVFDECDTAAAPTNKKVLAKFINATVVVGMSGSVGTHKNPLKNQLIHQMFGSIVYRITNLELHKLGHSAEVRTSILQGNVDKLAEMSYPEQYEAGIIYNKARNKRIKQRVKFMSKKGRLPALIISSKHKHILELHRILKKEFGLIYRVEYVHHKTPNRRQIQEDFAAGKIDILVGSYILKRGKNFPLMQYLCNAGGGDSAGNILQILGRATRKSKDKAITYMDDFWDIGSYLRRHSFHRLKVYKEEGFPLKQLFKKTIKN